MKFRNFQEIKTKNERSESVRRASEIRKKRADHESDARSFWLPEIRTRASGDD